MAVTSAPRMGKKGNAKEYGDLLDCCVEGTTFRAVDSLRKEAGGRFRVLASGLKRTLSPKNFKPRLREGILKWRRGAWLSKIIAGGGEDAGPGGGGFIREGGESLGITSSLNEIYAGGGTRKS